MAKKEVRFDLFCKSCKYQTNKEDEFPCDECLNHFYNYYSPRPVLWKEKEQTGNDEHTTNRTFKKLFKKKSQ